MRLIDRLSYSQNWNIGFCEQSPETFIENKKLNKIKWLKHPYTDRWFADPFILKVTDTEIVVFVEECYIQTPKGIIAELIIDKESMRLKRRYELLELDTHLSYPVIFHYEDKILVCPENGQSGCLSIYEYDEVNHRLINPNIILDEALADATIIKQDESNYYLVATKYPETQTNLYLYKSTNGLYGPYNLVKETPVCVDKVCSRPAGNFIVYNGIVYRPSQNCMKRYGAALTLMEIERMDEQFIEKIHFTIAPVSYKYNLGIHTINVQDGVIVVDGYGYSFPILGRLITSLRKLKHLFFSNIV